MIIHREEMEVMTKNSDIIFCEFDSPDFFNRREVLQDSHDEIDEFNKVIVMDSVIVQVLFTHLQDLYQLIINR
jgi:uncharacterized protein (DUF1786 family)